MFDQPGRQRLPGARAARRDVQPRRETPCIALHLGDIPGVGQGIYAWTAQLGANATAVRAIIAAATGGGNLALPDLQIDALFGSENEFLSTTDASGRRLDAFDSPIDTTDEAKARAAKDIADLRAVLMDPNSPIDRDIEAINLYGRGWATGNTALLAEGVFDPLSFLTVGRFLKGGRLAVAEAGGLRATRPGTEASPA